MIKCKINSLVIALLLFMSSLAFALPGAHDPNSGRGYTCTSCHSTGATVANLDTGITGYATNMCFRCHTGTDNGLAKSSTRHQ